MTRSRYRCRAKSVPNFGGESYKSAWCEYFNCVEERDPWRNWTLCLEMTSLCWFVSAQLSGTKGFNLRGAPPLLRFLSPNTLLFQFIPVSASMRQCVRSLGACILVRFNRECCPNSQWSRSDAHKHQKTKTKSHKLSTSFPVYYSTGSVSKSCAAEPLWCVNVSVDERLPSVEVQVSSNEVNMKGKV